MMERLPVLKGRYELKETLGQGGMGVVYRAYDSVLKCDVVVKTIRDAPEPAAVELFQRECEVLVALNHPNIVPILDIGQFQEEGQTKPYFVMPLLPGRTLDRVIRDSTCQLSLERCADVISQVCRALHAAHDRGLVHRDIKPGNIFVMPDFSVELIDFGVAHMVSMGNTGQKGTLYYMAPELLQGKEPSPLSDIFALGVTAYELFTRRRPFERPSEREVIEAILHEIPPPASDLSASINQTVGRVLNKAMAKQPWHRFSTARELADCLMKAARGEAIELFDAARIRPRVDRARAAFKQGDSQFALEILTELEAEGHLDADLVLLRRQIDVAIRQKRIRQLLDNALTRLEGEEYPLALQKIQEVLTLDPGNAEAFALKSRVENTRSERQIEGWFRLAKEHMENNAFAHAREALDNVLKLRSQSSRVASLLAEVDRREREYLRLRQEKEQLYRKAVEAHQKGELSSAMTMLERVLELDHRAPDSSQPERGAAYQGFYNQVRSEHDDLKSSYSQARKRLEEQRFGDALTVCEVYLRKFPGHALFQALKCDIEEQRRLQSSGYVAEVDKRVEAEPGLERRVEILQEALDRFPDEPHFQQALRLVRERLNLVSAIVAKARHLEDQAQYGEALDQWDILRTIHGRYPGLAVEIERLTKRREQQTATEAQARWVKEIDQHLQAGDYAGARSLCQSGLGEFPGDRELTELEKLARQSEERCIEAQRLLAQGEQRFDAGAFDEGLDVIRAARHSDARSPAIRLALVERLVARARALMDSDWQRADSLVREALDLQAGHAGARSLHVLLEDRKREEFLSQAAARARQAQAGADLAGAMSHVDSALAQYPGDPRLLQIRTALEAERLEFERAKTRRCEPEQPAKPPAEAPPVRPAPESPVARPEPQPAAAPAAGADPAPPPAPRFARRLAPAAAAAVILATAGAAWLYLSRPQPSVPPKAAAPEAPPPAAKAEPEAPRPAEALPGSLRVEVSPPSAVLSIRGPGDTQPRPFQAPAMQLPPGRYILTARSEGYLDAVRSVVVEQGGTRALALELLPAKPSKPEPEVRTMDPKDWDRPWKQQNDWHVRQGGGFTLYSAAPSLGTYQFTIRPKDTRNPLSNPKVRWVAGHVDPRNYVLFELDGNNYTCTDYRDGKPLIRVARRPHGVKSPHYSIRFYIEPARLVVMLMAAGQEYRTLDDWSEAGRQFGAGRFGFLIPGSDEIWLAHFAYYAPAAAAR